LGFGYGFEGFIFSLAFTFGFFFIGADDVLCLLESAREGVQFISDGDFKALFNFFFELCDHLLTIGFGLGVADWL
jgi:hypothetical protein